MRYLLDTNVCVMYLNGRSTSVRDRLFSVPLEDMAVCSIIKAELCVDLLFALVMQSIIKDLM
jgi:tRNA(fMet)-specific endonuclease VapC